MTDNKSDSNDEKSTGKKISGALKLIPVIGGGLEYLFSNWGGKYTLFTVFGFILGWSVIGLGYSPEFLIAKYRGSPPVLKSVPKPTRVPIEHIETPEWLMPYASWLKNEGYRMKDVNAIKDFMVDSFQAQDLFSPGNLTSEFEWVLEVPRNYEITGRAFKINKTSTEESFQLLHTVKDDDNSIRFLVPKCRHGDMLIAVLAASWKQDPAPASFQSIIKTKVR